MKTTYTKTMINDDLAKTEVRLLFTKGFKWEDEFRKEVIINGIKSWTLYTDEEARQLEEEREFSLVVDEYHEYLEIGMLDGTTRIYPNSHVTMFIW